MNGLSIGDVAKQAGVATSAIRYYERIGLLPPSPRRDPRPVARSTAARISVIASVLSVAGPYPKLSPMQPRPMAET